MVIVVIVIVCIIRLFNKGGQEFSYSNDAYQSARRGTDVAMNAMPAGANNAAAIDDDDDAATRGYATHNQYQVRGARPSVVAADAAGGGGGGDGGRRRT